MSATTAPEGELPEEAYWVACSYVPGLGPQWMGRLLKHLGSARAVWRASARSWEQAGVPAGLAGARLRVDPARAWERVRAAGVSVLTLEHPDFPPRLKRVGDAPFVLYLRGELREQDARALAVVGTRRPTPYGREAARVLAGELAVHGFTVVSGLARGVDSLAHRAALEAGGRTLAVLGSGTDRIYPPENRLLAAQIARQGAVLSEFPPGSRAMRGHFPRRNRIISGLSLGTLVVEAGEESGALITAQLALEQDREVFAVPGSIFAEQSAGTHRLILQGARPVRGVADILEGLARLVDCAPPPPALPGRPETLDPVLEEVGRDPRHLNEIVKATGLPAAQVAARLVLLELEGRVRLVGALHYVRR